MIAMAVANTEVSRCKSSRVEGQVMREEQDLVVDI